MASRIPPSPPRVSEKHFQRSVIEFAELCGYKVAHFADSRRQVAPGRFIGDKQAAGFPDLVICGRGRVLFIELKTDGGRVSAAQADWLAALQEVESDAAGRVIARVWRPTDFSSGEIERTLIGRRA